MFFCQISISDAVYASVNFKLSVYSPVFKEICIILHIFLGHNYFDKFTKIISTTNNLHQAFFVNVMFTTFHSRISGVGVRVMMILGIVRKLFENYITTLAMYLVFIHLDDSE